MSQQFIVRKQQSKSREEIQRFIDLGRMSASLLHEISSPLSVALINLEQINDQKSIKRIRSSLIKVNRYVDAAKRQLKNESDIKYFYLDDEIRDIKSLVIPLAKAESVRLIIDKPIRFKLNGDPIKFQKIIINLLVNSIESYRTVQRLDSDKIVKMEIIISNKSLMILVEDRGEGIEANKLPRLFDAFYTTKASNNGLGVGLATVKQFVEDSFNGTIKVNSKLNYGSLFYIKLPLCP
jgi:signal transduction histidine kinase